MDRHMDRFRTHGAGGACGAVQKLQHNVRESPGILLLDSSSPVRGPGLGW
jgi:hypothetical protein